MERKLIWRFGWQTQKCVKRHLVFPKLKKFLFFLFCFEGFVCSLVLVYMYFPLAETEVNAKGEWSSTSGRCSKIYPHSGRGRVEWSLALVVLRMELPSHWLNPYNVCLASSSPPPHHNQTAWSEFHVVSFQRWTIVFEIDLYCMPWRPRLSRSSSWHSILIRQSSETILDHSALKTMWITSWATWSFGLVTKLDPAKPVTWLLGVSVFSSSVKWTGPNAGLTWCCKNVRGWFHTEALSSLPFLLMLHVFQDVFMSGSEQQISVISQVTFSPMPLPVGSWETQGKTKVCTWQEASALIGRLAHSCILKK